MIRADILIIALCGVVLALLIWKVQGGAPLVIEEPEPAPEPEPTREPVTKWAFGPPVNCVVKRAVRSPTVH